MEGMWESSEFYATEWCQLKLTQPYSAKFVVVGDAGYVCPGLLARQVSRNEGYLATALKAYEERIRPIIHDLQVIPKGNLSTMAPRAAWSGGYGSATRSSS